MRRIGVEPAVIEEWLGLVLQKWHEIMPDTPIEPWDFSYHAGQAYRALGERIPLKSLRTLNDRFYRDLGADPIALQVHYDLEPRPRKDPVAFTTFGRRPRTGGDAVIPGEPWVFASYQIGGLENLLELLHETRHAVHIAAIRTPPPSPTGRTATASRRRSPTSPPWSSTSLGGSGATWAPPCLEPGIEAKYSGIVMDIAWALFEVQMHHKPERDPTEVWTAITRRYFRIYPHPDLAWWAVRGQLVDSPG